MKSPIIAQAVGEGVGAIFSGLDGLFTSDKERLEKANELARIAQAPVLAQFDILKAEASNPNWFVSGSRPAIMWVGAISLLYTFVLRDLLAWILAIFAPEILPPPVIPTEALWAIISGILGLGGVRTVEKIKGVAAK